MPTIDLSSALAALLLAGSAFGTAARPVDPISGPGVSRQLAAMRSATLSNVRYEMALSLERPDTARGTIAVRFMAKRSSEVLLDFRGPSLTNVEVNGVQARTEFNGAHLRIPASAIHTGENVVTGVFKTLIAPAGAAIIKF